MTRPPASLPVLAGAAALLLLVVYLALGGASFRPTPVANPCADRAWATRSGAGGTTERIALSALDGAACELRVSRETLALGLRSRSALRQFQEQRHISATELGSAAQKGLERAIDDADHAGVLNGFEAFLLKQTVGRLPADQLVQALRSGLPG